MVYTNKLNADVARTRYTLRLVKKKRAFGIRKHHFCYYVEKAYYVMLNFYKISF